jgi:hypothetical protein
MPVTFWALVVGTMPAFFQSPATSEAAAAASPIRQALPSRDSTRVLRLARKAQGDFETLRRKLLPRETYGRGGGCEAVVGRYCYRQQFTAAPNEAPQVVEARTRLLTTLDSVGALIPGDRWILGQRLRYLMEAGRPLAADSMAIACAGRTTEATVSWCLALVGYTAQQLGNYPRADAAFTSALAEMSQSERCKWEDVGQLIGRSAGPYRRGDCEERDSITAGFWRLVQPLYLNNINDLRTEFFARVTRMYIEQGTRTAMSDWWGSDDRQALFRYGVALWYTQGEIPRGESRPQIAGFRREPAFNFLPDSRVFGSPDRLTTADWAFSNPLDNPTYAPLWAVNFQPILDHQVALFRRGDSAYIVAAFDVNDGTPAAEERRAGVFAAVVDRGGVLTPFGTPIEHAGLSVVSTLVAPWRPLIISLETLSPARGSAGRTRFAPKLPDAGGRLSLSNLLFYAPRDPAPTSLAQAIPHALHATRAPSTRQVGVFWETYGVRRDGESLNYTLLVVPDDEGLIRRALVKLRVVEPEQTVTMQWREAATNTDGIASKGLTVNLSRLRPGRYLVRLTVTSGSDLPVVSERNIEVY